MIANIDTSECYMKNMEGPKNLQILWEVISLWLCHWTWKCILWIVIRGPDYAWNYDVSWKAFPSSSSLPCRNKLNLSLKSNWPLNAIMQSCIWEFSRLRHTQSCDDFLKGWQTVDIQICCSKRHVDDLLKMKTKHFSCVFLYSYSIG